MSLFNCFYVYFTVIEGGIAQAVPEHPKRDNIFSLSTAFGDAYLFQVNFHSAIQSVRRDI